MKNRDSLVTQITIANALELVADISTEILNSSEDVDGNVVGGAPLSTNLIYELAKSSFQIKLNNDLKRGA